MESQTNALVLAKDENSQGDNEDQSTIEVQQPVYLQESVHHIPGLTKMS